MKDKNLLDDIKNKSLNELTELANNIIEKLENEKNLELLINDYQKLIKLNNLIEKKFQNTSKEISQKTKEKIENLVGIFSSAGPISETRLEREAERGTGKAKDFISEHPIVRTVKNKKTLYLSPGHTIAIKNLSNEDSKNLLKFLFNHQTKKEFQMSFSWEKNSIVIWDNYSIIHSATPFVGRRLMHRIILDA